MKNHYKCGSPSNRVYNFKNIFQYQILIQITNLFPSISILVEHYIFKGYRKHQYRMLSFKCRDVGFDCSYEIVDSNDETIITKVKEHGKNDHKMSPNDFTPELLEKIKGSIKETE